MMAAAIVAVVLFCLGVWVIQGWIKAWVTDGEPDEDDVHPIVASPDGPIEGPSTNDLRRARRAHFTDAELDAMGISSVTDRARRKAAGEALPSFEVSPNDEDDIHLEGL